MKWFKNLKITQKFLFLSAVTLVGLITIGVISYTQLMKVGNSLEDMYDNKLLPIETISKLKNNSQYVRLALIELMINTDKDRKEELLNSLDGRLKDNQQIRETYHTDNSKELELLEKLSINAQELKGYQDEILKLSMNNQNAESYALYVSKAAPLLNNIDDLYSELIHINSDAAKTVNKENEKEFQLSIILLVSIILIVIIIYIVFSSFVLMLISKPIKELEDLMKKAEDGDLTVQSTYISKDEMGSLSHSFNTMLKQLRNIIMKVRESSDQVAASSEQLMASAEETNRASEHIAEASTLLASRADSTVAGTESVSNSMQEMTIGMSNITSSISLVSEHSNSTTEESQKGNIALTRTINQMKAINEVVLSSSTIIKELGNRSTEIEKIVAVISGLSEQTNLLALNASIEAARAGEHGKGFAVVANEVKKLAEESRRSAEHITHLIHDIQSNTMNAVASMDECTTEVRNGLELIDDTGKSFGKILNSAADVSTQSQEVSFTVEQLSASVEQITASMLEISQKANDSSLNSQTVAAGAEEQLASMEEITASAHALANMAEELKEMVATFKI